MSSFIGLIHVLICDINSMYLRTTGNFILLLHIGIPISMKVSWSCGQIPILTPSKAIRPSQTFVEHCVRIQANVSEVNIIEHLYSVT